MRAAAQQKYRRMIRELPLGGYCDLVCLVGLRGNALGQGAGGRARSQVGLQFG